MPNFKITQLPSASQIETDDVFPFVDVSEVETKKVATSQIIDLAAVTITEMPNLIVDPVNNFENFSTAVIGQFKEGSNIIIDPDGTISSVISDTNLNVDNVNQGTLDVQYGGTGQNTLESGSILIGNGIDAIQFIAPSEEGKILKVSSGKWVLADDNSGTGGGAGTIGEITSSNSNIVIIGKNGPTASVNFTFPSGHVLIGNGLGAVTSIGPGTPGFGVGKILKVDASNQWALGDDNIGSGGGIAGVTAVRPGKTNGFENIKIDNQTTEATASLLPDLKGINSITSSFITGSILTYTTISSSQLSSSQITASQITGTLARFTTISGSQISGSQISGTFSGSGALIDNLNVNRVNAGILGVQFGGTGLNSLSGTGGNGVLVGNGANSATIVTGTSTGQVLKWNNTTKTWAPGADNTGGGGSVTLPASPISSVQFNLDDTNFGGSSNFIWDNTNSVLSIGGTQTQTTRKLEVYGSDALINGLTVGRGNPSADSTNTALGFSALANNVSNIGSGQGLNNTAVGRQALTALTVGSSNTALGRQAASVLTSGSSNIAIGFLAAEQLQTGNNNTFIGYRAGRGVSSGQHNIFIGHDAWVTDPANASNGLNVSNTIIFRTATERLRITDTGMVINRPGSNPNAVLDVGGSAIISGSLTVTGSITELSTRAIKNNIQTIDSQLAKIMMLNPVSYNRKDDNRKEFGFVSEELREIYPEFVLNDAVAYPKMVSVLVGALKELTQKLENQQVEIDLLKRGLKDGSTSEY